MSAGRRSKKQWEKKEWWNHQRGSYDWEKLELRVITI